MSESVVQRLEAVAARLEQLAAKHSGASDEKQSAVVAEYQDYYDHNITPFLATCAHFDGLKDIAQQAETSFKCVKSVIEAQLKCKAPSQAVLMEFISPIVNAVTAGQKPASSQSPFFNHQKAWSEAVQLHNWLLLPAPAPHVQSTLEASEFYLNKVLSLAKDANDADKKAHRDWVAQLKALIQNLVPFVQQNFKMGLNWNPKGVDLKEFASGHASAPAAAPAAGAGGAPPPPPPVDPNFQLNLSAPEPETGSKPGGMAAVFSDLNKGTAITSGLKKVTADMKTKNMKDVPALESKTPAAPKAAPAKAVEVKKDPRLELRQGTWFCENYENTEVEIKEGQMKQNVYIYNCNGAVVKISDKVKSVQVDKCNKTGVVFQSVVSTFEVVNCKRITIQIVESCPSLNVDKTSGVQLILSNECVKNPPQIITSNATELNLVVPGPKADSDPIELPLPEQFLTVFENGKLTTTPIKHSGA
jgi:adenylyl cyclase-associated protein